MGIRNTLQFLEYSISDFSCCLWYHTAVYSTDGYWAQKHFPHHLLTSYSFFSPLWSGSHPHHLMKTALSQSPPTSMLLNPTVTFQASPSLFRPHRSWDSTAVETADNLLLLETLLASIPPLSSEFFQLFLPYPTSKCGSWVLFLQGLPSVLTVLEST